MRRATDEGSILPLVIVYALVSLALILVVTAASSLYLERKRLFTLADDAALVGAEAFDLDAVTLVSGHPRPKLAPDEVATAVREFLHEAPIDRLEGLRVEQATSLDGSSATVELSAWWRPPVVTLFVPQGLRITVTAVARSVFG